MSIAFKWTDYAVPSVPFSVTSHYEIHVSFLEWFCVAILRNVTLHTCNIHIHEITALNTTIIIMTIRNGQQWQGSLLFYKSVDVHRSGKYTAFGPCITLSLHTVVYWSTLHNSVLISLWLHHFYFSITMIPEWSVWHNLWKDDTKKKFSVKINLRITIHKIFYFLPRPKSFFLLSLIIATFQELLVHTGCKVVALPEILRKIKLNIWQEVLLRSTNENSYSDTMFNFSQNFWDGCSPYGWATPAVFTWIQNEYFLNSSSGKQETAL